jgi:hypothetical protein
VIAHTYHLLERGQPYSDLGAGYFLERHHSQAYVNRLVRQLQRLGHTVTLEPADDAA